MAQAGEERVFDFGAAVDAARRDYPHETGKTAFADLSSPGAKAQISAWMQDPRRGGMGRAEAEAFAQQAARKTGFMRISHATGASLVAANARPASRYLGADAAAEAAYAFNHELGHAVVAQGAYLNGAPLHEQARSEIAADVFAVLRGINTGAMTRNDARRLSLARAMKTPGPHLTSQAVDALLDAQTDAEIAALSPADIKKVSGAYADKFAPQPGEIEALARSLKWVRAEEEKRPHAKGDVRDAMKKIFAKISRTAPKTAKLPEDGVKLRRLTNAEWLENLASVCEKAQEGSLAQHVACKILGHALVTGKAGFPEEKFFDVSGEKWDAARGMLAGKYKRT